MPFIASDPPSVIQKIRFISSRAMSHQTGCPGVAGISRAPGLVFPAKAMQVLFDFAPQIALMLFLGLFCGRLCSCARDGSRKGKKSGTSLLPSAAPY